MAKIPLSRGQTSMEFTIILAVVLIIGLIVIGLAMFFALGSGDVSDTEAKAYWATQVRPLRISEMAGYYYSGATSLGEIALKIENIDSKPITLKGIIMEPNSGQQYDAYKTHSTDGTTGTLWDYSTAASPTWIHQSGGIRLAPNEAVTIYVRSNNLCSDLGSDGASTERFKNYLTFYYETPDFTGLSFKGVKPIKGSCSPS